MGRHGTRVPEGARLPASDARPVSGARRAPRHSRFSPATTGGVLIAAVAAGAAVPAVQTLDTHVADAESTTQMGQADLALASAHHSSRSATSGVAPVAMPLSRPAVTTASAGDKSDVASLTKAMSVARESGAPEFGRPYAAGDDDSLNGQIAKALGLLGLPQKLAPGVKKIIMFESTGKANAVNNSDSNAAAGTPSKGLMQLIDTTFRNAVLPSQASKGIFDPVANITAGVRTMIANHGMDALVDGGRRSSSGGYVGYGGSKLPDDGLGLATS